MIKQGKRINRKLIAFFLLFMIVLTIGFIVSTCNKASNESAQTDEAFSKASTSEYTNAETKDFITKFAMKHRLNKDAWPEQLLELMEKNPETKIFVLSYPLNKDKDFEIDLSESVNSDEVPLFLQWDQRWGYLEYSGDFMGLTGCGPTCLSMVSIYLLRDEKFTPKYIAEFSERNGYSVPGQGSAWTLISEGGRKLGLDVTEIPFDETRIIRNLEAGNPIICILGPGDFTTSGHFIVMTKCVDGKIKVNDPNSKANSEQLWDLSDLEHQIKKLWVFRI